MLALRLQSILFGARTYAKVIPGKQANASSVNTLPSTNINPQPEVVVPKKSKLDKLHKKGPELEVTKILVKHGPLTSHEIWRSYQILLD